MCLTETFRAVNSKVAVGRITASYYPYKELKHTWRARDGALSFRVSDYMRGSPPEVIESLAWYLVCRARSIDCPDAMAERYLRHIRSEPFWSARRDVYVGRAKNLNFRPKGNHRDLAAVFEYVNECYLDGDAMAPELAWVSESPRKRVGFYHAPLGILAVNRALDSVRIPRYVLEFVVYHEMLHGLLDVDDRLVRRVRHTTEFRRREQAFARHEEAQAWLSKVARKKRNEGVVPQV